MSTAVAIVNWNSGEWLRVCIESLLATTTNVEVLVIDNASEDSSLDSVNGFRNRVGFIRNTVNRGFAAAVNQGFQATSSAYVLVLNPDIRVPPGSIQLLEDFMNAHNRAAAAGGYVNDKYLPRALPTVGSLIRENLGLRRFSTVGAVYDRPPARNFDIVGGHRPPLQHACAVDQPAAAALLIRRDAYDDVGGFDEQFYPAWYEDVDFCRRLKSKGWEIYFVPEAEFQHAGGYSANALGSQNFLGAYYGNQLRYARKHFGPAGAAAVRASIAAGMIGRMAAKPNQAGAYAKALIKVLKGS